MEYIEVSVLAPTMNSDISLDTGMTLWNPDMFLSAGASLLFHTINSDIRE